MDAGHVPDNESQLEEWVERIINTPRPHTEKIELIADAALGSADTSSLSAKELDTVRETVRRAIACGRGTLMGYDEVARFASDVEKWDPAQAVAGVKAFLEHARSQGRNLDVWGWALASSALADALTRLSAQRGLDPSVRCQLAHRAYCCARASYYGLDCLLNQEKWEPDAQELYRSRLEFARVILRFSKAMETAAACAVDRGWQGSTCELAHQAILHFIKDERLDIRTVGIEPHELSNPELLDSAVEQVLVYLEITKRHYVFLLSLYRTDPDRLLAIYCWMLDLNRGLETYFRRNLYGEGCRPPPVRRILDHFSWDYLLATPLATALSQAKNGNVALERLQTSCTHFLSAMGEFFTETADYEWASYANGLASTQWAQILIDRETRRPHDPADHRLLDRCEVEARWARSLAELDPHRAQMKLATCKWAASQLLRVDRKRAQVTMAQVLTTRARIYAAFGRHQAAECALDEAERRLGDADSECRMLREEIANLRQALGSTASVIPGTETPAWSVTVDSSLRQVAELILKLGSSEMHASLANEVLAEARRVITSIGETIVPLEDRKGSPVCVPDLYQIARERPTQVAKPKKKKKPRRDGGAERRAKVAVSSSTDALPNAGRALVAAFEWICDVTRRTLPLATLYTALANRQGNDGQSVGEVLLGPDAMRQYMEKAAEEAEQRGHWLAAVECRLWLAESSPGFEPQRWKQALEAMDQWMKLVPISVDRVHRQEPWWRALQTAVARVVDSGDPDLLPLALEVGEKLRARSLLDFLDIAQDPFLDDLHARYSDDVRMMNAESLRREVGQLLVLAQGTAPDSVDYEAYEHVLGWQHHSLWYKPAAGYDEVLQYLDGCRDQDMPTRMVSFHTCRLGRVHWLALGPGDNVQGATLEVPASHLRGLRNDLRRFATGAGEKLSRAQRDWREAFRQLCGEHELLGLYLRKLEDLFESVVRPIREAGIGISDDAVTYFIPNEDTLGLPMHAAWDREARQFLIQTSRVAYTPSASCLVRLAQHEASTQEAGTACLAYYEDLDTTALTDFVASGSVPWTHRGDAIADLTRWCSGRSATAFGWLFLGGHGCIAETGNPWDAFVQLRDGPLRPLDVLSLQSELAFIWSCEVGQAQTLAGDTYGFLFGLMSGCTRSCILADMPIYMDRGDIPGSLASIPHSIYRDTHSGTPKLKAYVEAIRNTVQTDAPWSHPYFWAPFHFWGDAGRLRCSRTA